MCGECYGDCGLGSFDGQTIHSVVVALALHVADEDGVFTVGGASPFDAQVVVADGVFVAEQFFFG